MTTLSNSPILIVGAGPVGLSLAVALIAKGIPVRVFEHGRRTEQRHARQRHPSPYLGDVRRMGRD